MFIALEGVDGSGKSSLAAEIAKQIRLKYPDDTVIELHSGPLKRDPIEEYVFAVENYVPGGGVHIIADRWHYGEMVYGPLYRGQSAISQAQWRWIDLWLASRGVMVTVVTNTLEEIERRLKERGEDFLQPEHVAHVIEAFNNFSAEATYLTSVVVGGEKTTLEIAMQQIAWAELAEIAARHINDVSRTYVGSIFPDVVLVGDKRGGKPPYVTTGAFYPVGGNSAQYLWDALPEELWRDVSVINANEEDDLEALLKLLSHAQVIALGREASKKLKKLKIKHAVAPHPQYVRRFHNKKQTAYGELIQQLALNPEDRAKWPK